MADIEDIGHPNKSSKEDPDKSQVIPGK